jgi:hypothetical protein
LEIEGSSFILNVVIPPNTSSLVTIPKNAVQFQSISVDGIEIYKDGAAGQWRISNLQVKMKRCKLQRCQWSLWFCGEISRTFSKILIRRSVRIYLADRFFLDRVCNQNTYEFDEQFPLYEPGANLFDIHLSNF